MNLWSVSIIIEDQFKNLYSEYVEDFVGYVSSSLFLQENSNAPKKKTVKSQPAEIRCKSDPRNVCVRSSCNSIHYCFRN